VLIGHNNNLTARLSDVNFSYRASQQEFHEEVEDVDDDADDGAELDYA